MGMGSFFICHLLFSPLKILLSQNPGLEGMWVSHISYHRHQLEALLPSNFYPFLKHTPKLNKARMEKDLVKPMDGGSGYVVPGPTCFKSCVSLALVFQTWSLPQYLNTQFYSHMAWFLEEMALTPQNWNQWELLMFSIYVNSIYVNSYWKLDAKKASYMK